MFEFLFKYPAAVFSRGQFVFLTPWPAWLLILVVITVTALLVCAWLWQTGQRSLVVRRGRKAASASYAVPS